MVKNGTEIEKTQQKTTGGRRKKKREKGPSLKKQENINAGAIKRRGNEWEK